MLMLDTIQRQGITANPEQRLFVIPIKEGAKEVGYSCHGFSVVQRLSNKLVAWLHLPLEGMAEELAGTLEGYEFYRRLLRVMNGVLELSGTLRCPVELTPQLIGLERAKVEVVDRYGETRRFFVGRSAGQFPLHLEIERKGQPGGMAAYGTPYRSVTILHSPGVGLLGQRALQCPYCTKTGTILMKHPSPVGSKLLWVCPDHLWDVNERSPLNDTFAANDVTFHTFAHQIGFTPEGWQETIFGKERA